MKTRIQASLFLFLCAGACSKPPTNATLSPGGSRWVRMAVIAPKAEQEQLLPTQQLLLEGRGFFKAHVLVDDLENLCGVHVAWDDDAHLTVSAPVSIQNHLKVADGQSLGPVQVRVQLNENEILFKRWSEDLQRCLVVIGNCEHTQWNLYLRRAGEPLYNAAMSTGWDDPDIFGGFSWEQSAVSLEWTGPRQARILVNGGRFRVTVRKRAGDVDVDWVFTNKDKKETPVPGRPLPIVTFIPAKK